jgi:hypothetical protein
METKLTARIVPLRPWSRRTSYVAVALLLAGVSTLFSIAPAAAKAVAEVQADAVADQSVIGQAAIEISRQPYKTSVGLSNCGSSYYCRVTDAFTVARKRRLELRYVSCFAITNAPEKTLNFGLGARYKDGGVIANYIPVSLMQTDSSYNRHIADGPVEFVLEKGETLEVTAWATGGLVEFRCFVSGDLVKLQ